MVCFYANERKFQGHMLQYAKRFLTERPHTLFYLPLFLLFAAGLTALTFWQNLAFSSASGGAGSSIWNLFNGGFWSVLNFIQFIWGISFLRDACNIKLIQITLFFQDQRLTGIGTDHKIQAVILLTKDYSASIGEVSSVDLS